MPNRIIKESTFTSDKIAALSDFEFRLWVGLITYVDDAGRGDARPAIIRGRLFALRERVTLKDVETALHGLAAKGCVSLYTVDGKPYFWFPTWSDHQRIRDVKPKYPGPEDASDNLPQSAASCGNLPQTAASRGLNPIQSEYESESISEYESNPTPNTTCAAAVCADFLDRINSTPSASCLDELKVYAEEMGEAICKRAFDVALDNKKTTWPYIRGILRRLQSQGVKCLADWDALEEKRAEASARGGAAQMQRAPERKSFAAIAAELEAELKGGGE